MNIEINEIELVEIEEMINDNFSDLINGICEISMCLDQLNIDDSEVKFF